jgi:peptide/nickel transport system ATP-binding protein
MRSVPLLEAHDLRKIYVRGRKKTSIALDGVSVSLSPGSTLALVGRSGSGKSTLARCLALLEKPDHGEIRICGLAVTNLSERELRQIRPRVQLVWQHSALALNPRFRVVDVIAEPLRIQGLMSKSRRREQALAAMSKVGLPEAVANRTPLQLSGGQRQRVAIARALVQRPEVIILDEALSGLDMPLQTQIAQILMELKASFLLSYLFISHDLRVAASLADTIAVMDEGKIVESQAAGDLLAQAQSNAARQLLNSMPAGPI